VEKLWKIKCIPRHVHFAWRILHEKLPVKNDLFKIIISCDPLCVFCEQHNERISHAFRYIPFRKWLKRNIIDANMDIIVNVLALCYEIWCTRNNECFDGAEIDVAATVQKAQRSIVNFNNASIVLLEMLNGGPNLPIYDVHWTPPISG